MITTAGGSRSMAFGPVSVCYDPQVLTPRPWTLLQSHWAAELAPQCAPGPILELCAGAGQIGLAAAVLTDRALVQVEADPTAAGFAELNAARADRTGRVEIRCSLVDHALHPDERFPIILADPPYLRTADVVRWPDDPVRAIDGGPDGLDVIRSCLLLAGVHLGPGGALLLQVAGEVQAHAVSHVLQARPEIGLHHQQTRRHDADRAVMLIMARPALRLG